jgi:lipoprotein-anchoring transpeptidase ErfK/SrfK
MLAVCVPVLASPALAAAPPATSAALAAAPPATSAAPAAGPSRGTPALTAALSRSSVVYGGEVTVSGTLTPALGGEQVAVMLGATLVGTAETDPSGAYTLTFTPRRSGDVVAVLAGDPGVAGEAQTLAVIPRATVTLGAPAPYLPTTVVVAVAPAAWDGLMVVEVRHKGAVVEVVKARAKDGAAALRVPLRGVGGFTLSARLPAAAGLDATTVQTRVSVPAKTLSAGSSGRYVKGMLTAFRRLRFRVPGIGARFTAPVKDAVMAFQKAYRLPRTYVFDTACWRRLDGAALIKPRRSRPSTHLEVDKGRQIAMVVKGGDPYGIICVSTGATGNTPEGTFRIRQKSLFTTSGYGGVLVRTMGFVGNFALHGYAPVPPYPASHGCVREPIWASFWMYEQSWVGETLYIYH